MQEIILKATFKDATAEEGGLPPLRNTAEFGTIKDLTRLPHLNEPSSRSYLGFSERHIEC